MRRANFYIFQHLPTTTVRSPRNNETPSSGSVERHLPASGWETNRFLWPHFGARRRDTLRPTTTARSATTTAEPNRFGVAVLVSLSSLPIAATKNFVSIRYVEEPYSCGEKRTSYLVSGDFYWYRSRNKDITCILRGFRLFFPDWQLVDKDWVLLLP